MNKGNATRASILQKAFELVYSNGYRANSIDDILAQTNVTKGSFYHHFKNKDEMGLAIIKEVIAPVMTESFIAPLNESISPTKFIYVLFKKLLLEDPFLNPKDGCPVGNLVQELTPWHEQFSLELNKIVTDWTNTLAHKIELGKQSKIIKKSTDSHAAALFLISGYWGVREYGKMTNSTECYKSYLKELKSYLKNIKI